MKNVKRLIAVMLAVLALGSCLALSSLAAATKISACTFSYSATVNYTGKAIKPAVTVKYKKATLKNGTDYTLKYSSNTAIGTGKITVTGKGKYTGTKTLSFKIVLAAPKNLKASSITAKNAKLTWSKVAGATKYEVYSYIASSKKYTKLTTVKTNSATVTLAAAKQYKLCVKAFDKNSKASAYSAKITVNTLPATPAVTAAAASTSSIKLSWKKISGATGYLIYKYTASNKKYTKIANISKASTVTYTASKLSAGTIYAYAVAAYYKTGGATVIGAKSAVKYVATKPTQVTGLKASVAASNIINLSWTKVAGATGYTIYTYDTSKKTYTKLDTSTAASYKATGLKANTKYSFAVAAYVTTNGLTSTGAKSSIVSATTSNVNEMNDFIALINGGKFKIKYSMKLDGDTVSATTAVSGSTVACTMGMTMEDVDATMKYWFDGKNGVVVASAMGLTVYDTYNATEAKKNALDADSMKSLFAGGASGTPTKGTATLSGKSYTTYTYSNTVYYFTGGKCVRIANGSEVITISSYTGTVSSSDIKKPSTLLAVKMDIM